MTKKIKQNKVDTLISDLPELIKQFKNWWYDSGSGPSLYFYQKTISRVRDENLKNLLEDKSFVELLYATLTAWGMDARAASLKDFEDFTENIGENRAKILNLKDFRLSSLDEESVKRVRRALRDIYNELDMMKSKEKLVCVSKFLHFTLPDLVMPMDRRNTLKYFYGNTGTSRKRFLELFEASWQIAQETNLTPYVDKCFNLSESKVIDNAINAKMR